MRCSIRIAILSLLIRGIYAGFCTRAYSCQKSCSNSEKYYVSCGWFGWGRCGRYRTVYRQCSSTCYRQECCSGYSGSNCHIPWCFGSQSCPNGGSCRSPNVCICPRGFSTPRCNDINECGSISHGCQHNCVNTHGSYHCTCKSGYTLSSDLKSCLDRNECDSDNGGCTQLCNNHVGYFSCSCRNGYTLNSDGRTCSDLNECSLGTSGCSQKCSNNEGSFTCSCNSGYTLGIDKRKCEDVDECVDGTATCKGYCKNTLGSYTCYCPSGFIPGIDGHSCTDLNECKNANGGCDQICINEVGSHRCECRNGYILSSGENSQRCKDIDECIESTAACAQKCYNTDGSFTCGCNEGFILDTDGVSCKDIYDCEDVVCMNKGTCVDGVNSFTCICETGFSGQHCETDINECEFARGGCQDVCINTGGSFHCSCLDNRELKDDGFSCSEEDQHNQTVFERLEIARQLLPRPCFTVPISKCKDDSDIDLYLSSTLEWYKLIEDDAIMFTNGIVFIDVKNVSIPISLTGIEVSVKTGEFTLNHGSLYESTQGKIFQSGNTSDVCRHYEIGQSDIFDFLKLNSFTQTLFLSLFPSLPYWVTFEKTRTEILSVQNTKSFLVYGREMDEILWCGGAPVKPNHLYSTFIFSTGFKLNIFGDKVDIPKPLNSGKFCLIVDICEDNGGTVFLMIPDGSRDAFSDISILKILEKEQSINIRPRGFGLSLSKGINSNYHDLSGQLWNGDSMFLPIQPNVNVWIGGNLHKTDKHFTVDGNADIYFGVPSIQTMLTSMFLEEWTGVIDFKFSLSPILNFTLFGKEHSVTFHLVTATINVFLSIGGSSRQWCGEVSNPEGLFLSVVVEINPFKGIPFLEDFLFSSVNRVHIFMNTDPQDDPFDELNISLTDDILELESLINKTANLVKNALHSGELELSNTLKVIVVEVEETLNVLLKTLIRLKIEDVFTGQLKDVMKQIEYIRQTLTHITSRVDIFVDKVEFIINEAIHNFTNLLVNHINIIQDNVRNITAEITENIAYSVGNYTGFGLKFTSDWTFFGLKFLEFDFEVVYSEGSLFRCSRFKEVTKLFEGESAVRVLGRAAREYKLGYFLKYEKGGGLGIAFSLSSFKTMIHLQAHIKMLGIRVRGDLFISEKGLHFYLEGNVWEIFLARIEVSAKVGTRWDGLTFTLRGHFVVKTRKRRSLFKETTVEQYEDVNLKRKIRQVESPSFQDSYLDALNKVIRLISQEAQKRLTQVQNALTSAQKNFGKAQAWLEEKQNDVNAANFVFDNAVQKLEHAKQKLEEAKAPLKEALQQLEKEQININSLCRIKTCSRICIPGIKCKICYKKAWFVKIPYPCCKFTSCMISFPDPVCVLANIACRIIRAAAYVLLEIAKVFVRVAMLAYDAAKAALTVAQFVVDKSRVILSVAEGILELAKIGFEVAKGILESAKIALEAVKLVIGAAATVLQFVIENGLKNIIDVKNCGFDIEMSTKDLPVFEVSCEVNAFRLGWRKIQMKINFKSIFQSLWQAARATVKVLMNMFDSNLSSRKRRDVEFNATSSMHVLLRKIRESDDINTTIYNFNDSIDISRNISGFHASENNEFENRVELFREKCIIIMVIQEFMQDAFDSLRDIANESNSYISEIDNVKRQLQEFSSEDKKTENITVVSLGISSEYATKTFNMTENDIDEAINNTKSEADNDPLLNDIKSAAKDSEKIVDKEMKSVETIDFLNIWFTSMQNMTRNYFNESECQDFKDCMFYSISSLYVLYESEDLQNISTIQQTILDLESVLIETFQNESSTMKETSSALEYILFHVNNLASMNLFCSEAPKFINEPQNSTAIYGSDVAFICNATGDPEPDILWLKNGTIMQGEKSVMIFVSNVTKNDTYDRYNCIAGNVVANITSLDAFITVLLEDGNECKVEGNNCSHLCYKTLGESYICSCFEGFFLEEDGMTCSDIDECSVNTNFDCDHLCINTEGSFTCVCNDGYTLSSDNRTCIDIDECQTNTSACEYKCLNTEGSFICLCKDGYTLHLNNRTCVDINECLDKNGGCNQTCKNTEGSFTCLCGDGYVLERNQKACVDIDECLENNGNCNNTCNNTNGSFTCSCNHGYLLHQDQKTCVDIDECLVGNGGCDQICINTNGSFSCSCNDGYILHQNNKTCIDTNECLNDNGGCGHTCKNIAGSFTCLCKDGYVLHENNRTCIDIDECLDNNGGCDHICTNINGSRNCSCNDGYDLHANEKTCADIDECIVDNGGCDHNCNNKNGSFTCSCKDGFILDNNEKTCIDVDECLNNNGGCDHICKNTEESFSCLCNVGYLLQGNQKTCMDIDECLENNGLCNQACENTDGSFTCSCKNGYILFEDQRTCVDTDECLASNGGCDHVCINTNGSFTCSCNEGYVLFENNRTCIDANECLSFNGGCDHVCENINGSFYCLCNEGYLLNKNKKTCEDIDECLTNNGGCKQRCENVEGSFECKCFDGYNFDEDSLLCIDIDECDNDSQCESGCINFDGTYICTCQQNQQLNEDGITCKDVSHHAMSAVLHLSIDDETALGSYYLYTEIRNSIENYLRKAAEANIIVVVNDIRKGSIVVNYTVVFDEKKDDTFTVDAVVHAIMELETVGSLIIDAKPVQVKPLFQATDPCEVREQLVGKCDDNSHCQVINERPSCRIDEGRMKENYLIIVGPTIGGFAFLIAVIMLIFCAKQIRIHRMQNQTLKGRKTLNMSESSFEEPSYLRRKNLIWNFYRKPREPHSVQSTVNGSHIFPWMTSKDGFDFSERDGHC